MERITINAKGKILGRLASRVAYVLQGKHLAAWRPERREGPRVMIYNVDAIKLSGKKAAQGVRYRHSGYPGGLRVVSVQRTLARDPRVIMRQAVLGMLARNRLRARLIKKLTLVRGALPQNSA